MRFLHNPFTDKLDISGTGPGGVDVQFLTGNSGGAVPGDASWNINVLGNNTQGVNIVGTPGTSTLTVSGIDSTTSQKGVQANATNVQAAAQTASTVSLTPSNITSLFSGSPLPASQGGTGVSSPAAHSLLVTNGASAFTSLGTAGNGQIPIGSVGSNPVLATIGSSDSSIVITNGPGTIDIITGATAITFNADTGSATPAAHSLTLAGTSAQGISSSATGSTVTYTIANSSTSQKGVIALATNAEAIAGTDTAKAVTSDDLKAKLGTQTNHGVLVGAGTSSAVTALSVGTTGQVLTGSTGADPSFASIGTNSGLTSHGILLGQGNSAFVATSVGATNTVLLGNTGADPSFGTVPNAALTNSTITVSAGTGISVSGSPVALGGSVTISGTGGGLTWAVTTVNATMAVNNGYIANKAGVLALALPATAAVGSVLKVTGINTALGWSITQAAGQQIFFGSSSTTLGAGGSLASTATRDSVELVCVVADTTYNVISSIGNITVV